VFHEIAHNTLYVKSATPFNESYAQFVGYHAAQAFFRDQGDSLLARRAADRWHDEMVLGEFYARLVSRLSILYATHPDSTALEQGRADAGGWAREELEGPVAARLRTFTIGRLPERPVNNARLVGARIYRTRLDLFDRWFEHHGRDVRTSVAALDTLMRDVPGDSAYARLAGALGDTLAVVDTMRAGRDSTP
jgi:predicted aminopeptidase